MGNVTWEPHTITWRYELDSDDFDSLKPAQHPPRPLFDARSSAYPLLTSDGRIATIDDRRPPTLPPLDPARSRKTSDDSTASSTLVSTPMVKHFDRSKLKPLPPYVATVEKAAMMRHKIAVARRRALSAASSDASGETEETVTEGELDYDDAFEVDSLNDAGEEWARYEDAGEQEWSEEEEEEDETETEQAPGQDTTDGESVYHMAYTDGLP